MNWKKFLVIFLLSGHQAIAQQNTHLERLLDTVDNPAAWPANSSPSIPPTYLPAPAPSMRQQMLRYLLGGNGQATNSPYNNQDSSTAYSDWQEAENQAARARDAEEKARYETNKGYREDDASTAYYAANAARDASDRVYQASLNGDVTAKEYADRARAAADRARADADQARYYADTGK